MDLLAKLHLKYGIAQDLAKLCSMGSPRRIISRTELLPGRGANPVQHFDICTNEIHYLELRLISLQKEKATELEMAGLRSDLMEAIHECSVKILGTNPSHSLPPLIQRFYHILGEWTLLKVYEIFLQLLCLTCSNDNRITKLPLE